MGRFARIVAHHPYVILVAVTVFSTTCLVIPLTTKKLPNFSDPQLGFEARGTVIAQRLTAWNNLLEATRPSGNLLVNPIEQHTPVASNEILNHIKPFPISKYVNHSKMNKDTDEWHTLNDLEFDEEEGWDHHGHQHLASDGFFCTIPSPQYSRVVFGSSDGSDLFSLDAIHAICQIEHNMMKLPGAVNICETISPGECCQPWSLGNYIALLHNRTSCFHVTEEDVNMTKTLLKQCSHYYYNLQLSPDCEEKFCQQVPTQCTLHNAVYHILDYLVDIDFLPENKSTGNNSLKNTLMMLPIAQSVATLQYYRLLDVDFLCYGNVKITAMEFGLKITLFNECLIEDTWLIGAGGMFILLSMWLYTSSLFVTLMTVIAIIFSLGISYFMYTLLFELNFFPFMNLLASIVAVESVVPRIAAGGYHHISPLKIETVYGFPGLLTSSSGRIGADDAFIFCKVWQCAKTEKDNGTLVKLVHDTLKHATLSMFVTTLTTAAAFYASYVSSITAIGTATLANFAIMVTWLPASVVVSERWNCPFQWMTWDNTLRPVRNVTNRVRVSLDRCLVLSVTRLRYMWLVILGSLAVASTVVIFYHPRLKLPDTKNFQLFDSSHLFEQYDMVYKDMFWFERLQKGGSDTSMNTKLPLRFVWGILPMDDGNYLDPSSRGTLVYDSSFDMAAPESQKWLLKFCHRLRNQPFYQPVLGPLLPNCFMESFSSWMQRRCIDPIDNLNRTPCCETYNAPYKREVFQYCIVLAIADLYETPAEYFMPGVAGPKFCRDSHPPRICALVVEYDSNHPFSMSYKDIDKFYKQVEMWTKKQMSKAPEGMQHGWFISDLEFYDLQHTLSQDTLVAIVAILVLLNWKLNVLESIAISVAIGLAVDFSLHYSVHYRICPEGDDREYAVSYAISRMGGPTAMAALTTAAAGAFMLPSSILAYMQIGIFLVVVMASPLQLQKIMCRIFSGTGGKFVGTGRSVPEDSPSPVSGIQ
uniref:Patched domain-containing protein n=1 Tax=Timema genevievae TaxID=629358 RepID=A0A7R9PHX7_TIMGE|nr:unnamed protein product [Timema genevievae]